MEGSIPIILSMLGSRPICFIIFSQRVRATHRAMRHRLGTKRESGSGPDKRPVNLSSICVSRLKKHKICPAVMDSLQHQEGKLTNMFEQMEEERQIISQGALGIGELGRA